MFSTLEKIFIKYNISTVNELKTLIESNIINERATRTAYRVFLNYLEYKELVNEDILIKLRKKISLSINSNIDTFIPTKGKIEKSISIIKNIYPQFEIYYKLILESGCRPSELKEMIFIENKQKVYVFVEVVMINFIYYYFHF